LAVARGAVPDARTDASATRTRPSTRSSSAPWRRSPARPPRPPRAPAADRR
jgi:hypothetical protein